MSLEAVTEDMSMALKSMSIDKLVALKDQIEAILSSKVLEQRRALESELAKLGRFQGGKSGSKVVRGFGPRGAVAPKYRNPENPAETWAGRGLKPRWLAAAIKSGKKPEDFLIAGARSSPKANGGKKTRKAKKSAKK
jgi:DNA-binding protein H-NS